jgi:hypothetical protein
MCCELKVSAQHFGRLQQLRRRSEAEDAVDERSLTGDVALAMDMLDGPVGNSGQ